MKHAILVTGGAGFIGSHLVERLIGRGRDIVIVDDLNDYYDPRLKERNLVTLRKAGPFRLIRKDIRDRNAMAKLFAAVAPETVVHLAARAGVRPSLVDPALYADVNISGTINLLQLARQHHVRRFIFGSSSSVYGGTKIIPFREDDVTIRPVSPYGVSKLAGEAYCRVFHRLHGMNVTCLRFFTVYGPRQRPDMAIHKFTRSIVEGKPFPMFGRGDTQRDYTFVSDIVDGLLAAIDRCRGFHIYNLGDSRCVSLKDLIALIARAAGRKPLIVRTTEQPGDVRFTCADISRACRDLGYRPRVPIEEGIERYVKSIESRV